MLFTILFALYFYATSAVLYCIAAVITLIVARFDPNRKAVHWFSCCWGHLYVHSNPFWICDIVGRENIEHGKTYVLVSNHQSFADIVLLYGLFRHYKWVSKDSIFKVPIIGWNMYLNQYVKIERGNLKSIKIMLQTCKDWIARGSSVMIFAEGTRTTDGEIQNFRDGAFRIACESNVPLIPIVLDGTFRILGKGAKTLSLRGAMRARVLPPIDPAQFNNSPTALRDHVHALMKAKLAEMRGEKQSREPRELAEA